MERDPVTTRCAQERDDAARGLTEAAALCATFVRAAREAAGLVAFYRAVRADARPTLQEATHLAMALEDMRTFAATDDGDSDGA